MKLLRMKIFTLALIPFSALLLSCQSNTRVSTCQGVDWYELGRRSGTAGEKSQVAHQRKRCGNAFDASTEAIYINGYNNGLAEYCTTDNGYALGKSGKPYTQVCPRPIDQNFLTGYNRGKKVRELESRNENLDRQISSLNEKLKEVKKPKEQGQLKSELNGLQQELQSNRRRLSQMEKQIN